ncbi:MAG: LppP/LprE family lipoprotein [Solirubrobacterales bacterium]|nr:LppP/LprE family lipoprotein [Solirubrobacterales bacterium]
MAGGVAVAAIMIGLAVAAALLATGGGESGTSTTVVQRSGDETTVTESSTNKREEADTTVTTTVGRSSPEDADPAAAAVAAVGAEGYTVADSSDYEPSNTLGALVGSGGDGEKVFFFVDGDYIGTDTLEASGDIDIVSSSDTETEVSYGIYVPADPDCCPSGGG